MRNLSIVIPVYQSASFLHKTIEAVDAERIAWNWNLELVLVDDGSKDSSFEVLKDLKSKYPYLKAIKLSRNFGHQIAVKTGLHHTTGDYIAIIDDDLQDPPNLLPRFLDVIDKGYDVAFGIRKKRKESWLKKFMYSSFYRLLNRISDIELPLDSGDFCVMTKNVKDNMLLLDEQNPYLRGIRTWVGFKQIGVEYERSERIEGTSGYTLKKLLKIARDGIFSFSSLPLKVITTLGNVGLLVSASYMIYLLVKYFTKGIGVEGFSTIVFLIIFFNSLLLICIGVVGEYIYRIYNEVHKRPFTVIEEIIY